MPIKSIYTKYFQKSKVFLYPLLGIKRGSKLVPSQTFLAWNDRYKFGDMKLVCLYNSVSVECFEHEYNMLQNHNRLSEVISIDDENKLLVFDFDDLKDDWSHFVNGKYSRIYDLTKEKVLNFFENNTANYLYVKSYLYPEKYFNDYAKCLGVDVGFLKNVGELCNKPDLEKEKLILGNETSLE